MGQVWGPHGPQTHPIFELVAELLRFAAYSRLNLSRSFTPRHIISVPKFLVNTPELKLIPTPLPHSRLKAGSMSRLG